MSQPTHAEIVFAERFALQPNNVAAARDVFNAIAALPWARGERVALLARYAHAAKADVGEVLAGAALAAAPVASFEALLAVRELGDKRVVGLVRALAGVDLATLSPDAIRLKEALDTIAALRNESAALRAELDRLRAAAPGGGTDTSPDVMLLGDVAASVSAQVGTVDEGLRSRRSGLRIAGLALTLKAGPTTVGEHLALDFAAPGQGSAIGLSFVPGGAPAAPADDLRVPDVRGYTAALARRKLEAQGFSVAFSTGTGKPGVIADQTPPGGSLSPGGSLVRLIVGGS